MSGVVTVYEHGALRVASSGVMMERARGAREHAGSLGIAIAAMVFAAACGAEAEAPPIVSETPHHAADPVTQAPVAADRVSADPSAGPEDDPAPVGEGPPPPALPPAPPPVDVVAVDREGDDEEEPEAAVDLALRSAERIGGGPWSGRLLAASAAGLVSWWADAEDEVGVVDVEASVDHRARTYVVFRAPGGLAEYAAMRAQLRRGDAAPPRFALWLARLDRQIDPDGELRWRRVAALRLRDLAVSAADTDAECAVASELRARDLDGDGEVELTAIVAAAAVPSDGESCGALAFLVGGDDLGVQARFTREYRYVHTGADGDTSLADATTWIVRDVDGDGHADLHVTERWRFRDDFSGDWDGEGTFPGSHARAGDRREVDCPWDAASDTWRCPEVGGVSLGSALLRAPAVVAAPSRDPMIMPWPAQVARTHDE